MMTDTELDPAPTAAEWAEARRRIGTRQPVSTPAGDRIVTTGTGPSPLALAAGGLGIAALVGLGFYFWRR